MTVMKSKGHFAEHLLKSPGSFPEDFLEDAYWDRLQVVYFPLLQCFHKISKKAQSSNIPTLSSVPHWINRMKSICQTSANDGECAKSFKAALLASINNRMGCFTTLVREDDGTLSVIPNAIKAAVLDPRYSKEIQDSYKGDEKVQIYASIITDTVSLFSGETDVIAKMMEVSCESLMKNLYIAGNEEYDGKGCLAWWKSYQENDRKNGAIHASFCRSARMFLATDCHPTLSSLQRIRLQQIG